jgi:hypothetical protein
MLSLIDHQDKVFGVIHVTGSFIVYKKQSFAGALLMHPALLYDHRKRKFLIRFPKPLPGHISPSAALLFWEPLLKEEIIVPALQKSIPGL